MPANKIDIQKIIGRLKEARTQIENLIKDRSWIEEAKKVAEKQGQEVKKLLDGDVAKLKAFLEKEKKELEKLQAQIPGEVDKLKKFVDSQKKELTKLIGTVKATAGNKDERAKVVAKAKGVAKAKATEAKAKAVQAKAKATQAAEKVSKRVSSTVVKSTGSKKTTKAAATAKNSAGASTSTSPSA